jgi:hypothetical protein
LHSPFTPAQSAWLFDHHQPAYNLRSYMLLGVLGSRTWSEFLLLEPKAALLLVAGWRGVTQEEMRKREGVHILPTVDEVARYLTDPYCTVDALTSNT